MRASSHASALTWCACEEGNICKHKYVGMCAQRARRIALRPMLACICMHICDMHDQHAGTCTCTRAHMHTKYHQAGLFRADALLKSALDQRRTPPRRSSSASNAYRHIRVWPLPMLMHTSTCIQTHARVHMPTRTHMQATEFKALA